MTAKLKLVTAAPAKKTRVARKAPATAKRDNTALIAGTAFGGIAATGMALSMSHLAHGVALSTSSEAWEAWSMATMIDAGFVAAKLVPYVCRSEAQRDAVQVYAKPLAITVLVMSAYFNTIGFAGFVPTGWLRYSVDAILGCAAPGMIFALSQMAAILLLNKGK